MAKFILVSFNDENMEFEHSVFNTLDDAKKAMEDDFQSINDEYVDDEYLGETSAWVVGAYTKSWKIISL